MLRNHAVDAGSPSFIELPPASFGLLGLGFCPLLKRIGLGPCRLGQIIPSLVLPFPRIFAKGIGAGAGRIVLALKLLDPLLKLGLTGPNLSLFGFQLPPAFGETGLFLGPLGFLLGILGLRLLAFFRVIGGLAFFGLNLCF